MKKFVSLMLALVMIMGLATTAFAATTLTGKTSATGNVWGKYEGEIKEPEVISVDITWGDMEFTYTEDGTNDWNPANHTYKDNGTRKWTATGNTVVVTNHSNVDVTVGFAFTAAEGHDVTGTFDVTSKKLTRGLVDAHDTAPSVTATLTLDGTLANTVKEKAQIGTITVTIE